MEAKSSKRLRNKKRVELATNAIAFSLLLLGSVMMMYPLVWMVLTSLKSSAEVYRTFIPEVWDFTNYPAVWLEVKLPRGFLNSFITTVPVVLVQVLVSAMAAFAFAKLDFKGKNGLFLAMLATMMVPFTVVMVPQVIIFRTLGLLKGPLAVMIPKMFGSVTTIFFLRQFMYGIPDSLLESAKLDGAGYNYIFIKIMFPLIMPAVATQFILSFIGNWNDFLGPMLFIRGKDWYTLPLIINEYSVNNGSPEFIPRLMAASLISMVPIIAVFVIFQKKIVNSIVFSAIKG